VGAGSGAGFARLRFASCRLPIESCRRLRRCARRGPGGVAALRCRQCSNLLYQVHPLYRSQRGIPMHSYENRSQIRALAPAARGTGWCGPMAYGMPVGRIARRVTVSDSYSRKLRVAPRSQSPLKVPWPPGASPVRRISVLDTHRLAGLCNDRLHVHQKLRQVN
jgi:hypothetical protein